MNDKHDSAAVAAADRLLDKILELQPNLLAHDRRMHAAGGDEAAAMLKALRDGLIAMYRQTPKGGARPAPPAA